MEKIQHLLNELPSLRERNEEILDECERMLTEEEEYDNELRSKLGNNCSRSPSAELNGALERNLLRYRIMVKTAQSADGIVREKYEQYRDKIALLCLPENATSESVREKNLDECSAEEDINDVYTELLKHLEEGTKFYNDLTQVLVNFQNKVNDFCFARNQEREELLKTFSENAVTAATQPSPL